MVEKELTKAGVALWERARMYKAVAQTVFLYGDESWTVMGTMLTVIEDFHYWVARKTCGKDSLKFWGLRAGMATSGRNPGSNRDLTHQGINSEAKGHYYCAHFQPSQI